ncbi:S9 family peptidase [Flavobacterium tegetincola]|uniref:S9 family peptidase n=1 Tax=Flavobacterium tegetincola TaxID=150172 RepID=UPI000416BCD9|nr:prolyl oligopeptidase family serine peptidase [Flavobacterium tegetincola]
MKNKKNRTSLVSKRILVYLSIMASLLISLNGFSQNKDKKELTANDYHLWSSLRAGQLSESGKWMSFALYYDSGNDTLFVKSTIATTLYNFPGASKGAFIGDKWFSAMSRKGELLITDLSTTKQQTVEQVVSYDLRVGTTDIIFMKKKSDEKKQLEIKNVESGNSLVLNNVENYWYNSKADAVAYTTKSEKSTTISLLNLSDKTTTLIASTTEGFDYSDTVWQHSGNSIAFLQQPLDDEKKTARTSVGYYSIDGHKLYTFNPAQHDDFPTDMEVISSSFANLSISDDGSRIFFGMEKTTTPIDPLQTQIWNADDKFLYPVKINDDNWNKIAKVAVWWPEQNRFSPITDNEFPKMMLSGDQKYAFIYNPAKYEPQENRDAPLDIYILNLETGERKLVLQNQSTGGGTSISIFEKHIAYFKNKDWWIYDITRGLHRNLTKELGVFFSDNESDWPEEASPFGNPAWIQADNTLLVYDKYDIWSIALDGSSARRLTKGRENKTTYRIAPQSPQLYDKMNYDVGYKIMYQPSERLVLKTEALEHKGYCFWDKKNGVQPLLDKKMHTSRLLAGQNNDCYVYQEENYNFPPRLLFKQKSNSKEKVLFQSNPQHFKYNWGRSKLISYTNSKGTILNGVLFYPANYNSQIKYPMIIHLYEKQSKELYKYVNPSQNNPTGFNISNFTSNGYFVFLPDIVYEIGNPGPSAVDCVVSATKKVIDSESIDRSRIGLTGHSYGGYETDYIITQTDIFAAAVAGAAITDFVNGYLWVVPGYGIPNFYHYEFGQLRIGKSLYEDYPAYLRNSPLYHADKVNTPLLSWAGDQDGQVDHNQTIEFYLALRRLGKINTMLLYPGANHVLMEKKHQEDLTQRIEQWFDYYLKGNKKPEWL